MALPEFELWGGVECTINRIGDDWHDQCARNGHDERPDDFTCFAELGFKRLRQPILWEKAARFSECATDLDFSLADQQMTRLKAVGIEPIVGLLHHGSGPRTTSLLDPEFPEKLARYARTVAERYPRVRDYTPINEPLTTARFSALYGVWYPHAKDDQSFLKALLNECRATVLAMREIRRVNPEARLIQTEDIGRAQGTEPCREQVDFENERRWLCYDLLTGRVKPEHPLWRWLTHELNESDLMWFVENPCPPDVIGVNHYLLSNRFLDHRLSLYPVGYHGGNGVIPYADVGSVHVTLHPETQTDARLIGHEEILREVLDRYGLPVAMTEVHVDGARETQMLWLQEAWNAAQVLRGEDRPVIAITLWSLLGSFDWNSLCVQNRGYYESGAFDLRSPKGLYPTALAKMARGLAMSLRGERAYDHPALHGTGWWRGNRSPKESRGAPILITGAAGTLGQAFARIAASRGLEHRLVSRKDLDIAVPVCVQNVLDGVRPWAVINTAGYVRVDEAENDFERCFRENVLGSEILAHECAKRGIPYLSFSSDLVFSGERSAAREGEGLRPYLESDQPGPLGVYGRTKAEMEKRVLAHHPNSLVVRTSSFFGPWDEHNFVIKCLRALKALTQVRAPQDVIVSPTYVPQLAEVSLNLLIDGASGLIHLTNKGEVSWAELAQKAAGLFDLNPDLIVPHSANEAGDAAKRPRYSPLGSERLNVMVSLEEALERYKHDLRDAKEARL